MPSYNGIKKWSTLISIHERQDIPMLGTELRQSNYY